MSMDNVSVGISVKRVGEDYPRELPIVARAGMALPAWEAVVTLNRGEGGKSEIRFEGADRTTVVKRTTEWLRDVL